jgi:hypothetical protein
MAAMGGGRWKGGGLVAVLTGALLGASACGSGADPGPSSGLPRDAAVKTLSPADEGTLCDWVAGRIGGYSHRITCANGNFVMAAMSRMACEQGQATSTCNYTVGQVEDCTNATIAAPCAGIAAACQPLIFCP